MAYVLFALLLLAAVLGFFRLLTVISKRRNRLTATEVAERIEKHILGTEGPYDWDRFISVPIADDRLDAVRLECSRVDSSPDELEKIVNRLRAGIGTPT